MEKRDKKRPKAPISSSKALQIAMEDLETSHFIKTNFTYPEHYPEILTHKWISRGSRGYKWNVEIVEKHKFSMENAKKMLNIARIEIDSETGRIIRRHYLRNIFSSEYKRYWRRKREQ
jgi:hypothetical protein